MAEIFVDTHCHIHEPEFFSSSERDEAYEAAVKSGVVKLLLVGTSLADSRLAVEFARKHPGHLRATVGIHPHEASKINSGDLSRQLKELNDLADLPEVVAVGECGFDFFYNDRNKYLSAQTDLLLGQIEIAGKHNLPLSFHVRSAFDDFWAVFDKFTGIKGVLHSFTDTAENLNKALERGLFIGMNGIATFATDKQSIYRTVPLDRMLLETDSPFLAPVPYRGQTNQPKNIISIAEFVASMHNLDLSKVASVTTNNAKTIFSF